MEVNPHAALRDLFGELVWRHFFTDAGLNEPQIASYVSDLLVEFIDIEKVYRLRDTSGRRLNDVGEMLIESNPLLDATSFDRERAVRKHVGDYTLFMTGLFPENVAQVRTSRRLRPQALVDFIEAGKESYAIVACFDQGEYRDEVPLFRMLSEQFELCMFGLNMVRRDLETTQQDQYRRFTAALNDGTT
jgi:hypothetical protein